MRTSHLKWSIIIFIFSSLFFGLLAVLLGKELNWDLANYHYYNPYAFFHDRSLNDYWLGSYLHVFFNPALDFINYFVMTFLQPFFGVFLLGFLHGINFWLLFLIAYLFVNQSAGSRYGYLALLIAFIGIGGAVTLAEWGSTTGDNIVSIFVLSSLAIQIFLLNSKQIKLKLFCFSAIILGIGIGLKLTISFFAVGFAGAWVFYPLRGSKRIALLMIWSIGIGIGIALSSGFWMLTLWHKYHNPLFPLFNGIFHSPYFLPINWHDDRFMPHGIIQWIFYPFYFSWNGQATDLPLRDFRFPVVYVLLILFLLLRSRKHTENLTIRWFILFFVISYLTWEFYFSNIRYLNTLEMLCPLMIYLLINELFIKSAGRILISLLFIGLVITTKPMGTERLAYWGESYFSVKIPSSINHIANATVLIPYSSMTLYYLPFPQTYLIPFFPQHWHFIGIPFVNHHPIIANEIQTLIKNKKGPFFMLSAKSSQNELYHAASQLGFTELGQCETIDSDRQKFKYLIHDPVLLCSIQKPKK